MSCQFECCSERHVAYEDRIPRQVVEERRRRLEEQWQIELDSGRRKSLAHAAIDAGLGRLTFKARAEAAAKSTHTVRIERHFPRRQHAYALERIERALRLRIEAPNAFDHIVKEVNAQGGR